LTTRSSDSTGFFSSIRDKRRAFFSYLIYQRHCLRIV
jgi:hypothetical protein